MVSKLPYRQVHLDFHTSEHIKNIGSGFTPDNFKQALKLGHVDSITLFTKCHHGWSYHPTSAGVMHPHLGFDLLGEQIAACKEMGVRTPVYVSAGFDQRVANAHPDWVVVWNPDQIEVPETPAFAHYDLLCLNTPYIDILVSQVEEAVARYDCDEIFMDIVDIRLCYCKSCLMSLKERGENFRDADAVKRLAVDTYYNYAKRIRLAIDKYRPGLPVFHNGGHIRRGDRKMAGCNTHLELESLPTGGWSYDHFPMSAAYARTLGMDFTGMTGKFHTSWADFGGYKHPNALRYETALSIANGAGCCIGDQLHPSGIMDDATYKLIGNAYESIEDREKWCIDTEVLADVAVLSAEAFAYSAPDHDTADTGVARMLLEGHYLFDFVDIDSDFNKYKVLILPDVIECNEELTSRIHGFIKGGGKLLATGVSGLGLTTDNEAEFCFDFGCEHTGRGIFEPSYIDPAFAVEPFGPAKFVMKFPNENIRLAHGGRELAVKVDPYFNRTPERFSSHQHTSFNPDSASPAITEGRDGIYCCFRIFSDYANNGHLILRKVFEHMLDSVLADNKLISINLPSTGVTTIMKKCGENALIHHILYAPTIKRGTGIEVIEDIPLLHGIDVVVKWPHRPVSVTLVPEMAEIDFNYSNGKIQYKIGEVNCHRMIEIKY